MIGDVWMYEKSFLFVFWITKQKDEFRMDDGRFLLWCLERGEERGLLAMPSSFLSPLPFSPFKGACIGRQRERD